jgi:hypothetical protein
MKLKRYGIFSQDQSPRIASGYTTSKGYGQISADFASAANFIILSVAPLKQNTRNIGALNTTNNKNAGRAGRGTNDGANHGHGQGARRHGRGTRGRGRPGGRGTTHTGYYSPQDWQALTVDQHTQVPEARGTKHSINGVEISMTGDMLHLQSPTSQGFVMVTLRVPIMLTTISIMVDVHLLMMEHSLVDVPLAVYLTRTERHFLQQM